MAGAPDDARVLVYASNWWLIDHEATLELQPRPTRRGWLRYLLVTVPLFAMTLFALLLIAIDNGPRWGTLIGVAGLGAHAGVGVMIWRSWKRNSRIRQTPWLIVDWASKLVSLPRLGATFRLDSIEMLVRRTESADLGRRQWFMLRVRDDRRETDDHAFFCLQLNIAGVGLGDSHAFTEILARRLGLDVWLDNVKAGGCSACGYDLRGTIEAGRDACPECGNPLRLRFHQADAEPPEARSDPTARG